MKTYIITSNEDKLQAARKAFENTEIQLERFETEFPEIQASSSLEIARHAVEKVMDKVEAPIIREDHSLYLDAIPGFPGPYISYFDKKIEAKKLLELLEGKKRTGYFEVGTVLGLPNGKLKEYEVQVPIKISEEIKGDERNWDRVLMMRNENKTFAETDSEERLKEWNQNFRKIAEEL